MGKGSDPPPIPDYSRLAKLQAELNRQAAQDQTSANRPDQYTPFGSSTWTQDENGVWTQNTALTPEDQVLLDNSRAFKYQQQDIASHLLDKANTSLGTKLDLSGIPQIQGYNFDDLAKVDPNSIGQGLGPQGQYDMSKLGLFGSLNRSGLPQLRGVDTSTQENLDSGFGAVQQVKDAIMSRLAPDLQQQRDAEIQRLKNQGLTEDSEAFKNAMITKDRAYNDAEMQALQEATSAYGDIFNRGLARNNQLFNQSLAQANLSGAQRGQLFGEDLQAANFANSLRGQQFGEQTAQAALDNANRNTQFGQNAQIQQMLQALRGHQFEEQTADANLTGQRRQQALTEQDYMRQSPLNDYLKVVNGTSPSMPTMPSFVTGSPYAAENQYGAAADAFKAALDEYNAGQASNSNMMNGLFSLGGSYLGNPSTTNPFGGLFAGLGSLFGGGSAAGAGAAEWGSSIAEMLPSFMAMMA